MRTSNCSMARAVHKVGHHRAGDNGGRQEKTSPILQIELTANFEKQKYYLDIWRAGPTCSAWAAAISVVWRWRKTMGRYLVYICNWPSKPCNN
jgi:hypothetical protein